MSMKSDALRASFSAARKKKSLVEVVLLVFCIALSACTGSRPADCKPTTVARTPALSQSDVLDAPTRRLVQAFAAPPGVATGKALILSGGGAWGAFGAGYLDGWFENHPYDSFKVVSGVSTGALLSTFAFIGDRDKLRTYRNIDSSDIYRARWLPVALFSNSLVDTKPLRRLLQTLITPDVLRRVAEESEKKNRQLVIGSVNADSGQFEIIILTDIAKAKSVDDYIDALMASAAIPVAFPPVFRKSQLGCDMYVDGGVRHQMFYRFLATALRAQQPNGTSSSSPTTKLACAIVNGQVESRQIAVANSFAAIGSRSLSLLLNQSVLDDRDDLLRLFGEAVTVASADGVQCDDSGEAGGFNKPFMQCLYRAGYQKGTAPNSCLE